MHLLLLIADDVLDHAVRARAYYAAIDKAVVHAGFVVDVIPLAQKVNIIHFVPCGAVAVYDATIPSFVFAYAVKKYAVDAVPFQSPPCPELGSLGQVFETVCIGAEYVFQVVVSGIDEQV